MKKSDTKNLRIVFFGTPEISTIVLDELHSAGITPILVVTAPDAPKGRGLQLTPTPVKTWALAHDIDITQPTSPSDPDFLADLHNSEWDLSIIAAYGAIIPKAVLNIPRFGVLNVHPSLLPQLRGASPVRSAILADMRTTGVSIMQVDEKMDHGPIVAQASIEVDPWPQPATVLEKLLFHEGGKLLAEAIPPWIAGEITPEPQNHAEATRSVKIKKEDGLLDLSADGYQNYLKFCAYDGWPSTYFFAARGGKRIRVKIVDAIYAEGKFQILKVTPEGKREMAYEDFMRAGA